MTQVYDTLTAELAAANGDIENQILSILKAAPQPVARRDLIRQVFGVIPATDLSGDTHDRKLRKAIQNMRQKGIRILSSAHSKGYSLPSGNDQEGVLQTIAEMESRIRRLAEQVTAMRKRHNIPDTYQAAPVSQMRLPLAGV